MHSSDTVKERLLLKSRDGHKMNHKAKNNLMKLGHFVLHFRVLQGNISAQKEMKLQTIDVGKLYASWFMPFGTSESGRMPPHKKEMPNS